MNRPEALQSASQSYKMLSMKFATFPRISQDSQDTQDYKGNWLLYIMDPGISAWDSGIVGLKPGFF